MYIVFIQLFSEMTFFVKFLPFHSYLLFYLIPFFTSIFPFHPSPPTHSVAPLITRLVLVPPLCQCIKLIPLQSLQLLHLPLSTSLHSTRFSFNSPASQPSSEIPTGTIQPPIYPVIHPSLSTTHRHPSTEWVIQIELKSIPSITIIIIIIPLPLVSLSIMGLIHVLLFALQQQLHYSHQLHLPPNSQKPPPPLTILTNNQNNNNITIQFIYAILYIQTYHEPSSTHPLSTTPHHLLLD